MESAGPYLHILKKIYVLKKIQILEHQVILKTTPKQQSSKAFFDTLKAISGIIDSSFRILLCNNPFPVLCFFLLLMKVTKMIIKLVLHL